MIIDMNTITVSPKFQVVVPLAVRERLKLTPGDRLEVLSFDGRIELIKLQPMSALRGMLAGMEPTIEREGDRL